MKSAKKYYAYFLLSGTGLPADRQGICDSWKECEKLVSGKTARFRGFATHAEAEAWLSAGAHYETREKKAARIKTQLLPGIYFDAGTGRGNGVEISVTDESGKDLLHTVMPKTKINKHGKHLLSAGMTNNYGELMACQYALKYALKNNAQKIFGDSKLVIDYWSKGYVKRSELPKKTAKLADAVAKLRKEFEMIGGEVGRISGADNPADLGFH